MKYLITGGEGFIGYHLARELVDRGEEVVTYDAQKHFIPVDQSEWPYYLNYRIEQLVEDGVTCIRGDTTDRGRVKATLEEHRPDVIIHLAALPIANVSNEYPEEARTNIFEGTVTMLDVLSDVDLEFDRFVYTSSSMVYGDFDRDDSGEIVPASEGDTLDPLGIYGGMKLSGENLTRVYGHRFDIPYTIIRPSAVYGPTDCNRRVTEIFLTNALAGDRLRLDNGGHHELDFSYVTDVVNGFIRAAERPEARDETFNITRAEGRSIRELAEVIADRVPGTEMYTEERNVYRPNRGALDISKAQELLDYDPEHSLEDGIDRYLKFVREEGP